MAGAGTVLTSDAEEWYECEAVHLGTSRASPSPGESDVNERWISQGWVDRRVSIVPRAYRSRASRDRLLPCASLARPRR